MTGYATPESLLAGDLSVAAEDVQLPSGAVVRLRGLSRFELLNNGKGTEDPLEVEARNVKACLIEPKMTIDQVRAWQRVAVAGGDFQTMSKVIRRLSGLDEGAQKSDVAEAGD